MKVFETFRLDTLNHSLWHGEERVSLAPKAFDVLRYLVEHSDRLVTQDEILDALWPETYVNPEVIKKYVLGIRKVLGDQADQPTFVATFPRRGYQFIAPVRNETPSALPRVVSKATNMIVGRDGAFAQLQEALGKASLGQRQVVFITGEAGIGKTALVDTFAWSIAFDRSMRIARGQCLDQYGTSEAYLPVLQAIERLCREQPQVVNVLRTHAPLWLLQMPSLLSASDRESLNRETSGATRERMLREMGEALEALAADLPLVLILEDLHWTDYSTLDLISYLANQRQAARLMLIGTYRPVELVVSGHPLKAVKRELQAKQQCQELRLECLSEGAVAKYLSVRFSRNRFPIELAGLIHERTDGNPLFMVNAVDYLLGEASIVEHGEHWELAVEVEKVEVGVPDSIKQIIEKQVDHLSADEQRTLEAASVAGAEFSSLALVAGLREDRATVEGRCDALARQGHFIQDCGVHVLPKGGEEVSRYSFIHALYQNVLYQRVSASRRVQLHRRIGQWGEEVYGEHAGEISAELAMHFERGRDYELAANYLRKAADNAIRRFAYREAVGLARRGLELLNSLPETQERLKQELCLQLTLGVPLIAIEGYAAPNVGSAYSRARTLCQQLGETRNIFQVLWGLWAFHILRAELATACEIAEQFLRLAEQQPDPWIVIRGHASIEVTLLSLGEFAPAMDHFEKGVSLYGPERDRDDCFRYTQDPRVAMPSFAAWALWFLGRPQQASDRIQEALILAGELAEPHGLAHALFFAAIVHQLRREPHRAQERAEAAIAVSSEHGLMFYQAQATIVRGWALIEQGLQADGIKQMRQGLAARQAIGTELARPQFLGLLAEALGNNGQVEEGLRLLEEAVAAADSTGERCYEAELHRLKGELWLMQSGQGSSPTAKARKTVVKAAPSAVTNAERCFDQSIKIAQRQSAKSLELRAVMSLARLYQKQGRLQEGRRLLSQVYDKFTEGFDTLDLREAKALLDELPL